jgi:hypothetical protein
MDKLLAWCEAEQAWMRKLIEGMQKGTTTVFSDEGGQRIDKTEDCLAEFQRRITELDEIIARYKDSANPN